MARLQKCPMGLSGGLPSQQQYSTPKHPAVPQNPHHRDIFSPASELSIQEGMEQPWHRVMAH